MANTEQEGRLAPILTPRSRSPVGQSREEELILSRALLLARGDQTPVIVFNRPTEHSNQALGCLTASRGRSPSPSVGRSRDPSGTPASTPYTNSHTTPVPAKCKKCCCESHHKLTDHKLKRVKREAAPSPACDLSDFKLTFCEQATGLKGQDQFNSVNQMIWSCELDLKK